MKINILPVVIAAVCLLSMQSCKKKIYGCTDTAAENHSTVATDDDNSCIYPGVETTVTAIEMVFYSNEFSGSNGYYTAPFSIANLGNNDAVFFEWKCGSCSSFDVIPKTFDDFFSIGVVRNGSSFILENVISDITATNFTAPYFEFISGQTLKAYVISQKILTENDLDINNVKEMSAFVHKNV